MGRVKGWISSGTHESWAIMKYLYHADLRCCRPPSLSPGAITCMHSRMLGAFRIEGAALRVPDNMSPYLSYRDILVGLRLSGLQKTIRRSMGRIRVFWGVRDAPVFSCHAAL